MLHLRRVSVSLGLLAALLGLGFLAGCGSDSSMPTGLESISGSASSHDPGAIPFNVSAGKSGKSGKLTPPPPPSPIVVSKAIDGAVGGEVVNGRYKVWFAPGAFTGTKTISITDPQTADGQCVLGPEGLEFSRLVILTIDVNGTLYDSPFVTIEWWNPSTALWVDMAGIYSASQHSVYTVLRHFSTYRPRAGW